MDILTNEAYATCVCDAWIAVHSLTAFARLAVHYHATDFYCVLRRKSRVFCRARTGMHLFGRMRPSSTMSPAVPHTTGQRVTFRIDPVVEKSSVCERRAILECIPPTFFLFFFPEKRKAGGRQSPGFGAPFGSDRGPVSAVLPRTHHFCADLVVSTDAATAVALPSRAQKERSILGRRWTLRSGVCEGPFRTGIVDLERPQRFLEKDC
jgi:hypothetical protein